ncbi:hypothetical protein BsWGS_09509 [Bradybaena similaris]
MWISICLSAVFLHLATAVCPGDWLTVSTNDSTIQACYKIFSTERRPFSSAATFCQGQGGYLARDTTATVHAALRQALQDAIRSATHPTNFWIGLTDNNGTGGPWRWLNGPILGTYTNFANPNVTNTPNKMDCVYISSASFNMKWYVTTNCDTSSSLICQRDINAQPIVPSTQQPLHCPPTWTSFPELHTCIRLYSTPLGWTDARLICKQAGGDLVKIINSHEEIYVNSLIYAQKSIYWIGLNDRANEGKFVWLNETVQANFTNWDTGMPNNNGGNADCVAIDGNKNFKWSSGDCGLPNRFVCQTNPLAGTVPPPLASTASSTNCDSGWITVPNTDSCVQFNTNVVTWMDARSACRSVGADLASIASGPEQVFLVAQSYNLISDFFWIGANEMSPQNGWQWADGSPLSFLNWDDQEPNDEGATSLCAGFAKQSGRWVALFCQDRHGYMCMKKGKVTLPPIFTSSTTPTKLPGDVVFGCPTGWNSFRGSCYKAAYSSTGVDWGTANATCSSSLVQGALVAIVDNDENDFITAMLPSSYSKNSIWIGLEDPLENTFTWVDGTPVQYTNWDRHEPFNLASEDCVKMSASNGKWQVTSCDSLLQVYICKRNKYILPFAESNQNPGCQTGSLAHGPQCYAFISNAKNFNDAETDCKTRSGNLVTVYSEQVEDFLAAQLSVLPNPAFWIGLSQIGVTYSWQSHFPVILTYWGKNHTGLEQSTCVAVVQDGTTAVWANYPCTNILPYICEATRTNYTTPSPVTTVARPQTCPAGWKAYGNNCYKMLGTSQGYQLTWSGAQSSCSDQATGGSLVTISDSATQTWLLQNILSSYPTIYNIWIGLNDRDNEGGYVWADNSPFLYQSWASGEPNNYLNREDCIRWNISGSSWYDDYCYLSYSYICQVPTGSVIATAGPHPTGYANPQCGDYSWIMYNGFCYYMAPPFGVGDLATWFVARQNCLNMGADLVSITGSDENGFLTFMSNKISTNNFWIGLNDLDLETFGWIDSSPLIYVSWDINEPDDAYGEEKCVEINSQGLWNDAQCQEKKGYFCKKRPGNYSPTQPAPTVTSGGCARDFVSLPALSYCYFVGGTSNATSKNFTDAMKDCDMMAHKAELASIHTKLEEKFILVLASNLRYPAWIGLNDRRVRNQFEWVDNLAVSYTHWKPGQPNENLNDNSPGARQDCVDVEIRRNPGTWSDRNCNTRLAYICESKKGATLPTSAPNTTGCLPGYQRFRNSCYKFFQDPLNWTSAESGCQKDGGNLATLNSGIEQAFVEILVEGSQSDITQIWIGLQYVIASAAFTWADGWPVRYTNWGPNEPNLQKISNCVAHTVDDHWQVSSCTMELSYVCEINFGSPPPPAFYNRTGRCPDSTWTRNNGYCYHIETSTPSTWAQANAACQLLGANLTSIHSNSESIFLTNLIGSAAGGKDVWIGLYKGVGTGFTWYDGTPNQYTYWAAGEPNDPESYLHQDCVKASGQYGTWADTDCLDKNAYVCKTTQRGHQTYGPNSTRPTGHRGNHVSGNPYFSHGSRPSGQSQRWNPSRHHGRTSPAMAGAQGQSSSSNSGLSGGSVAGIVIGMLVVATICTGIGFVLFRRSRGLKPLPFNTQRLQAAMPGFSNVTYDRKSDEKVNLSNTD